MPMGAMLNYDLKLAAAPTRSSVASENKVFYFDTDVRLRELTRLAHFFGQYFIDEGLVRFSFFLGGLTLTTTAPSHPNG
jgi:hypothetical protein